MDLARRDGIGYRLAPAVRKDLQGPEDPLTSPKDMAAALQVPGTPESAHANAEHIFIEDELSGEQPRPKKVAARTRVRNRATGVMTEMTFYAEGLVRLRQGTRKKLLRNHLIELEFLDPDFDRQGTVAVRWAVTALLLGLAAAGAWLLSGLPGYGVTARVTAVGLAAAAIVLFGVFLLRTRERIVFSTRNGRIPVLCLSANPGCVRRMRQAATQVRHAIGDAVRRSPGSPTRQLRAEMQAHYRLLEAGVIDRDACARGTSQILARFG